MNFYSANEPVVTICTSTAPRCRQVVGELRCELRGFWADVDLTTSVPGWLDDR